VREQLEANLCSQHNTSLFVSSWDLANSRKVDDGTTLVQDLGRVDIRDITDWWGPRVKDVHIRSYDLYMQTTPDIRIRERSPDLFTMNQRAEWHGIRYMNRIRDQWLCVRDGLRMIEDYELRTGTKFDLICRSRSDVAVYDQLPSWPQDRILFGRGLPMKIYDRTAEELLPDHFAIGPRDLMMRFKELSATVERLYDRQYRDTTNAESMITDFVIQQDLPIAVMDVPAYIVGA
jgi:hypothetical protein